MFLHDIAGKPLRRALIRRVPIALFLIASMVPASAPAAEDQAKGLNLILADSTQKHFAGFTSLNKYALVVGINEYENKAQGITPLRYAVGDARSVYGTLVDPRRGGFRPENVALLTDDTPEKPSNTAIGKALNRLVTQTREGDLVLIFFSGHGYEEGGRAYLLPANADLEALDYSAIERDAFVRQIDKIAAKKVIVILDACHSGGVNRGGKGAGKDAALSTKYYENFAGSQGRAFIASSAGGELSWEDEDRGHGVFTSALVDALSGRADTQPKDGLVSLNELRGYVETEVSDWAAKRGKSQRPQVSLESAHGDMPLALNYSYLESQSKDLGERRDTAGRVKAGLATIEGLEPTEMAQALSVVDRYGQALPMSGPDVQHLQFVLKLVDGSIDVKMYRAGVANLPKLGIGEAPPKKKGSILTSKWFLGGVVVAAGAAAALSGGGGDGDGGSGGGTSALPGPPQPPSGP